MGSENRSQWESLKRLPITETSFRAACDLMQTTARTDINRSYGMLAEYVPLVRKTRNRHWVHILLMGWARAKSSMVFSKEGELLYQQARENAGPHTRFFREALVGTALMYGEWGREEEFRKYLTLGERECQQAKDWENLSFIYTFMTNLYLDDTARVQQYFAKAIRLATSLPDKNALFTARYNRAVRFYQNSPQRQVTEFESLLELAKDSSLNRYPRKLYERTAFTFRNAGPSVYYQLMQINLLLTDYENAWKFAELFYNATVKPNPASIQAAYFNAEIAVVKAYQNDLATARTYLDRSRHLFGVKEDQIPYAGYFTAAGLLAEKAGEYKKALGYYGMVRKFGGANTGLNLLPNDIYYAHALVLNGQLDQAGRIFETFRPTISNREYTAAGYYYYKQYAGFLKAKGDYLGYSTALNHFYAIKDSLTNLNQYRAIQEILAKVRIRDKEQQISRLNAEGLARDREIRRERGFYAVVIGLAVLIIVLLVLYLRNRQIRSRQQEALQKSQLEQLEKQRHIELMEGIMQAEEKQRHQIADQLHHEVNAMLALATINISSALEKGITHDRTEQKLYKTQEVLTSVSTTIRGLSHQLMPLNLERYGFRKAIEELAETVNLAGKIKLETVIIGFENPQRYSISLLNDVYRIILELVQNILKHAKTNYALIEVIEHEHTLSVMVEDEGIGIDEAAIDHGKGLRELKAKVAYLNGQLEIKRKADRGTIVVLEIPT
ncbi:tetratricopeptide repeat-containing sensor histidine kinase [Larkinella sp. VNQ87]|uniref:sensor histidine kinase n=1 Tax=Larkinella sp. VNQ87 TaxID=3400921 RepID=UPI003BFB726C